MSETAPLKDPLVAFARKVATEDVRHDHLPGSVWVVMLKKDEAHALRAELANLVQGSHMCETTEGEWRPCPASLCEAERLVELMRSRSVDGGEKT